MGDIMKTQKSWKLLSALVVATAVGGVVPSVASAESTLRVAFLKVGNFAPMAFVPELMKDCGVRAQMTEFVRYADARTAMVSDSVDVGSISPGDILISLSQGGDKIIGLRGDASSNKYLVVRKGVEINDWADIKGKKIGIAPGSAVWFQWAATLQEKGIPYNSFTAVNIQGGGTAFVQTIKRGDVDAVVQWPPFEEQIVTEGVGYFAKNLEYGHSKAVGDELGVIAATRGALQNKRKEVECFLSAYHKAEQMMKNDFDTYVKGYVQLTGFPLDLARISAKNIKLGGTLDADQLRRMATEFHRLKVIPTDVSGDVHKVWNDELYQKVSQGL